jgi:hypothetical protein
MPCKAERVGYPHPSMTSQIMTARRRQAAPLQSEPTFVELFTPKLVTILREGYGAAQVRADVMSGLTVAILALPPVLRRRLGHRQCAGADHQHAGFSSLISPPYPFSIRPVPT